MEYSKVMFDTPTDTTMLSPVKRACRGSWDIQRKRNGHRLPFLGFVQLGQASNVESSNHNKNHDRGPLVSLRAGVLAYPLF
jgi:hypothetical protein